MTESETLTFDKELSFPDGIPGFPELKRFALVAFTEDGVFHELQSLETDMSMVVCVPWLFFPDYAPELPDSDVEALELEDPADAIVFSPVSFNAASQEMSVNLLGPFVVNKHNQRGRQVVLADSEYSARAPIAVGVA